MATSHKRKHRRFTLCYPVRLEFRSAGRDSKLDGVTKNVSVGGLLLESPCCIPKHCPVTFTLMAQGEQVGRPIQFAGEGKVVRVEPDPLGAGYVITLKCLRPVKCHLASESRGAAEPPPQDR